MSQIPITDSTKLLDVLAEEFEDQGLMQEVDINGLTQITGLVYKGNGSKLSSSRGGPKNMNQHRNDDYKNTLSSLANIQLEGGVSLNEFHDDKQRGNINQTKLSGGDYKVQYNTKEKNGNNGRPL